ncbi:hypothetical protein GE09DRAFT_1196079 [Coniochaeta sp. 2T2.1]|nr:hypothetical protein GE09DRAFT_1196079 [Coniochaeta sp. 2T2.1]
MSLFIRNEIFHRIDSLWVIHRSRATPYSERNALVSRDAVQAIIDTTWTTSIPYPHLGECILKYDVQRILDSAGTDSAPVEGGLPKDLVLVEKARIVEDIGDLDPVEL